MSGRSTDADKSFWLRVREQTKNLIKEKVERNRQMTIEVVMDITKDALFLVIKTSLPILLVSLIVGLVISIFQTVTSIQEQTLTFVPKIICVFLAIMLLGSWIMTSIVEYTTELWSSFSLYIRK